VPLAGLRKEQRKDTRQHQLTLFELKEDNIGRSGNRPLPGVRESAFTSCGHVHQKVSGGYVPILLQKSFSTADQNFSRLLVRFSDNM
jgi:hypothetical protein